MTNMLFNTGLAIHTHAKVVLPADIGRTMAGIVGLLPHPGLEFGLYLKGTWDAQTATVTVAPGEYIFPAQQVTAASIRFLDEPPGLEWNVIIHRHPHNCRVFSATDKSSINEEFLASVLFIPMWEFPDAIVNIPIEPGVKFQTKAIVEVQGGLIDVPDELVRVVAQNLSTPKRVVAPVVPRKQHDIALDTPTTMGRGKIQPLGNMAKRPWQETDFDLLSRQGFDPEDMDEISISLEGYPPSTRCGPD